jgi:hypothetical protein
MKFRLQRVSNTRYANGVASVHVVTTEQEILCTLCVLSDLQNLTPTPATIVARRLYLLYT